MGRLTSEDWFSSRKKELQDDHRGSITENVKEGKLKMRAYIGQTTIRVSDLLALETGDIIKINKEATDDLILQIEGKSKFAGKAGQFRGQRAFKISRKAKPGEKI